jgi:WD40 repeat protein
MPRKKSPKRSKSPKKSKRKKSFIGKRELQKSFKINLGASITVPVINHDFTKFAYGRDFPPEPFYSLGWKYNKTDKEKKKYQDWLDDKKAQKNRFSLVTGTKTNKWNNLKGHTARISSISLNYDGTRIVSSSDDGEIRVWDFDTGKCILTLKKYLSFHNIYKPVVFNHDGTKIASTSDCAILVWNVDKDSNQFGKCILKLGRKNNYVDLWTVDYDWDEKDMDPSIGHTGFVQSIKFSHDGKKIISRSTEVYDDNTLRVWNVDKNSKEYGKIIFTADAYGISGKPFAINHCGSKIVYVSIQINGKNYPRSTDNCREIIVQDINTGKIITLNAQAGDNQSVEFNHDGTKIISGSSIFNNTKRKVSVWDAYTGECIFEISQPFKNKIISSVGFNHDGTEIFAASFEPSLAGNVQIYGFKLPEKNKKESRKKKMLCVEQTTKKYTGRKSPPYKANECCGETKKGNDGLIYVSVANVKGVCRWVKQKSVEKK